MSDKPEQIDGYDVNQTERAEQVLLEIWSHLGEYREHFVLVGGLAPRYLVPQNQPNIPKHCGTLDVDLAVSLTVADVRAYASIRSRLERMGLKPGVNTRGNQQRHSFTMPAEDGPVVVDFLTTMYDGPATKIRAVEKQLSAIQVEGLGLALVDPVKRSITGKTLTGGLVTETIQVSRPVPFVLLKALAFENRREGKDVHDLVYVLQHAESGISNLAASVRDSEREAQAFARALESLRRNFDSPTHDGPVRHAQFLGGRPDGTAQAFAAVQEFLQALGD